MRTPKILRQLLAVTTIALGISAATPASAIGLLILEGSDAQTLHGLEPYSTDFLNGLPAFSTAPALPIAILSSNPVGTPTVGKTFLSIMPSLADLLAGYSSLYIGSPGTCCDETPLSSGDAAIVKAFLDAGRSVAIEDYQGGAVYDVIIGNTGAGAGTANSHIAGYGGGYAGLGSCFDGNIVANGGAAFGLGPVGSAVPNIGCFGHQAYEESFFDPLGFTTYIVTTPPGTLTGFNVVISNGGGAGCGLACVVTPEPASLSILGMGVAALALAPGLGSIRRRRQNGRLRQG